MATVSKIIALGLLFFASIFVGTAQTSNKPRINTSIWNTLSKVTYKVVTDQYGEINMPVFGKEVKELEGKEISISGYIVPADGPKGVFKPDHFILSSLPPEACFFCGSGGPESVVEVYMKESFEYTSSPITIKGKLSLNGADTYQLMYILEDSDFEGIAKTLSSK